ncbi:MerR family transcriptional regulator [Brevibacillus sp. B_LB10_24]|uniref:MerR family transcriptional regulator n=1 Tax=Brevibacillus sp. B_LB10_24 TaxID=3380645 RepID=UPI0038BB182D
MSLNVQVWLASKEVADRLDLHVRTLRNWLEMFVPVNERQKNAQGHYLISEHGVMLLTEVKKRKDAGNASLRDIQRQMVEEGLIRLDELSAAEEDELKKEADSLALDVQQRTIASLHEVEQTVQETLFHFQQELTHLSSMQSAQAAILEKIADIEEMQESLRLEIRRVTFEMDLMHQRMTRRKERQNRYQSRWRFNPLRWFSREQRLYVE